MKLMDKVAMYPLYLTFIFQLIARAAGICNDPVSSFDCLNDPCSAYTVLEEPWRSTSNRLGDSNCDRDKNGWYRFIGSGGVLMSESCPPPFICGTFYPLWLNGKHPTISDGIVTRTICTSSASCCAKSSTIQIKACPGGYLVYKLSGTPDNACSEAFCTDPSTKIELCAADEELTLIDGSYQCYCQDKYKVTGIADIRPELTCGVSDMTATFHKCQLKSLGFSTSSINLKDSSCLGFHDDPTTNTFTIKAPLQAGSCGLQITKSQTDAIYENTLHFTLESMGLITRDQEMDVKLSCSYPLDMIVSLNTAVNPIFGSTNINIGGNGQFTAYMALYQDSSYLTPYEGSKAVLSTKSMLYVGVFIVGGDSSQYALVMKNCYATPSTDPNDAVKYYIIKDSCPNTKDSTISVPENGVSRKGRLSLQVFKFVGNYNSVYIHCAVSLCDVTAGTCVPSCSGIKSRSAANEQSYQLTVGPITQAEPPLNNLAAGCTGTRASSALLGFGLLLMTQVLFV